MTFNVSFITLPPELTPFKMPCMARSKLFGTATGTDDRPADLVENLDGVLALDTSVSQALSGLAV